MSSNRFIRDYRVTFTFSNGSKLVILPPTQIVFNGDKSVFGGLNTINMQITNLNSSHRKVLAKRKIDQTIIKVKVEAGYVGNTQVIYKGTVYEASTLREGADFITSVSGMDGGEAFYNSFIKTTVDAGVDIHSEIISGMDGVESSDKVAPKINSRPTVLEGNPVDLIQESLDPKFDFFIDNEQCYIIEKKEVVTRQFEVVEAKTGLINVPIDDSIEITFDTILNPSIRVGGGVIINSSIDTRFKNIKAKVRTINFNCSYDGSDWVQTVTCLPEGII